MKCTLCGNEAVPKTITKKATGESWDGFECQSGCMKDEAKGFKHFFFAPKEVSKSQPLGDSEVVRLLSSIDGSLQVIKSYCVVNDKKTPTNDAIPF